MRTTLCSRESKQKYYIIHEGREEEEGGGVKREALECQLEQALERGFPIIIVEPVWLGSMSVRLGLHLPVSSC